MNEHKFQQIKSQVRVGFVSHRRPGKPPEADGLSGTVASTTVVGSAPRNDTGLGMMQGTSPSICALPDVLIVPPDVPDVLYEGWQVAFQANTGDLWVV
jgi:hypothetical protein